MLLKFSTSKFLPGISSSKLSGFTCQSATEPLGMLHASVCSAFLSIVVCPAPNSLNHCQSDLDASRGSDSLDDCFLVLYVHIASTPLNGAGAVSAEPPVPRVYSGAGFG